jgi:hypothetical protein
MQRTYNHFKEKIPLFFLVIVSLWWAFYYQSSNTLNDFGAANFEWLYLIDGLLVLPVICFLCIKDKKQTGLKALIYSCLVILIGSYIIPESSKVIWHYLESGRYLVLAVFILFELIAITTVYLAISTALKNHKDPDEAISNPIETILGKGIVAKLLTFETRMWSFALFAKRIKQENYVGDRHFSYHQKDGAHSNLLGFIIIILVELPLAHALLHFIWSPMAANIISALTVFSLVFFIAEYRAITRRPISVDKDKVFIRVGLFNVRTVNISNIKSIEMNHKYVQRSPSLKRYNLAGNPNVILQLKKPIDDIETIYIGLDQPGDFIKNIESKLMSNEQ